ncbi:MAG: hypothetical protein IPJ13_26280 [Saprospiraceae bacterium]|nr:hypothetical protein [Saprospiraceae bacterium]
MATKYWPTDKPLPFDEKQLKRLLQTPKIKKEKKKVIRALSIDHVHFYVSDLERTLQFYNDFLALNYLKVVLMKDL